MYVPSINPVIVSTLKTTLPEISTLNDSENTSIPAGSSTISEISLLVLQNQQILWCHPLHNVFVMMRY